MTTAEYQNRWKKQKLLKDPTYFKDRYDPRKYRNYYLRSKFGISIGEFNAMAFMQGGRCAICEEKCIEVVDHDHETGKIRGLLCRTCNTGIGHLKDKVELLKKALLYLTAEKRPFD